MPRGLDPGLSIHLHRDGLGHCDTHVVALGETDPRAHAALHLALDHTTQIYLYTNRIRGILMLTLYTGEKVLKHWDHF